MQKVRTYFQTLFFVLLVCFALQLSAAAEDLTIADFTVAGSSDNWVGGKTGIDYADALQSTVTRVGKSYSLEWANHSTDTGTNRLRSPGLFTLGKLLEYDYFNVWMYSDTANGQLINFYFVDTVTGKTKYYAYESAIKADWTGWKLISVNIADLSVSSFDKSDGTKPAEEADKMYVYFQSSGYSASCMADTLLYIDSVWISAENPSDIEDNGKVISSDVRNNMCDINPEKHEFVFRANQLLKLEKDYYKDKITVTCNDIGLEAEVDYKVNHEHNLLYVTFSEDLKEEAQYCIELSGTTELNSGIALGEDLKISFTVNTPELTLDGYKFNANGHEIFELPASGTVKVSVNAANNTDKGKTAVLIVGVYDKATNIMVAPLVFSRIITIEKGQPECFEAEVTADSYSGCYVRAFLWQSEDSMYSYADYGEL